MMVRLHSPGTKQPSNVRKYVRHVAQHVGASSSLRCTIVDSAARSVSSTSSGLESSQRKSLVLSIHERSFNAARSFFALGVTNAAASRLLSGLLLLLLADADAAAAAAAALAEGATATRCASTITGAANGETWWRPSRAPRAEGSDADTAAAAVAATAAAAATAADSAICPVNESKDKARSAGLLADAATWRYCSRRAAVD